MCEAGAIDNGIRGFEDAPLPSHEENVGTKDNTRDKSKDHGAHRTAAGLSRVMITVEDKATKYDEKDRGQQDA